MFPGYSENPKEATSRGAVVYYTGLAQYHDFKLVRVVGEDTRVDLWARPYMSSKTYKLVGTLTTLSVYHAVVRQEGPRVTKAEVGEDRQKTNSKQNTLLRNWPGVLGKNILPQRGWPTPWPCAGKIGRTSPSPPAPCRGLDR